MWGKETVGKEGTWPLERRRGHVPQSSLSISCVCVSPKTPQSNINRSSYCGNCPPHLVLLPLTTKSVAPLFFCLSLSLSIPHNTFLFNLWIHCVKRLSRWDIRVKEMLAARSHEHGFPVAGTRMVQCSAVQCSDWIGVTLGWQAA